MNGEWRMNKCTYDACKEVAKREAPILISHIIEGHRRATDTHPKKKRIGEHLLDFAALAFGASSLYILWQLFQAVRVLLETTD